MTNELSRVDAAVELFGAGCACSQAVLGPFAPGFGLASDIAMRVAAGFAGGMRSAGTCGAVTGGIMVIGLARCTTDCRKGEGRADAYAGVLRFTAAFERRNGALRCGDLLGCDISTPEGAEAARARDLFKTRCPGFVRDAAEILEEMLAPAEWETARSAS